MKDKVVIVTGGGGALGRVVCDVALGRGAKVASIERGLAQERDAVFVQGGVDLADAAAAGRAIGAVKATFGRIDALLNVAGGFAWEKLSEGGPATWEKMFRLNVLTALMASKAALPHLIEARGAIVNVGANGAVKAGAGMGAYAASKQGVMKLTEALAEEQKGKVRVNAVLPSTIDTPANRKDMPKADFSTWVTPQELASVMLFLASDDASAITGALIPVMGRV